MAWYICGRCGGDTPYLTLDKCTPCLTLLDNIKPGTTVNWRHGKGWAQGTLVGRYRRNGSFVVRTANGRELVRRDIYLPSELEARS